MFDGNIGDQSIRLINRECMVYVGYIIIKGGRIVLCGDYLNVLMNWLYNQKCL